tara:strand:- start:390 stop:503 length:114 start_codon:yes stop_codon:yes gene_type:complete
MKSMTEDNEGVVARRKGAEHSLKRFEASYKVLRGLGE